MYPLTPLLPELLVSTSSVNVLYLLQNGDSLQALSYHTANFLYPYGFFSLSKLRTLQSHHSPKESGAESESGSENEMVQVEISSQVEKDDVDVLVGVDYHDHRVG